MIILTHCLKIDQKNVTAIKDWEPPKTLQDVQYFLGFANFYQRFIKSSSAMARPLTRLTRKDVKYDISLATLFALESLKKAFTKQCHFGTPWP
jgi:hypothetical protein